MKTPECCFRNIFVKIASQAQNFRFWNTVVRRYKTQRIKHRPCIRPNIAVKTNCFSLQKYWERCYSIDPRPKAEARPSSSTPTPLGLTWAKWLPVGLILMETRLSAVNGGNVWTTGNVQLSSTEYKAANCIVMRRLSETTRSINSTTSWILLSTDFFMLISMFIIFIQSDTHFMGWYQAPEDVQGWQAGSMNYCCCPD